MGGALAGWEAYAGGGFEGYGSVRPTASLVRRPCRAWTWSAASQKHPTGPKLLPQLCPSSEHKQVGSPRRVNRTDVAGHGQACPSLPVFLAGQAVIRDW